MATPDTLMATVGAALLPFPGAARAAGFALLASDERARAALAGRVLSDLAPLAPSAQPLSSLDARVLVVRFPGRVLGASEACFQAAYALADAYGLESAEPDLATDLFPVADPPTGRYHQEGFDNFPSWCWAPEQPELRDDPLWALRLLRVPEAWAFSRKRNHPAAGHGVLIAQPDTGLARHVELGGLDQAPSHDFVDGDDDPTDPLDYSGNPGHGTGTASVVAAPGRLHLSGSAPAARLMPIRAIESVVRVSQMAVAEAIDFAVAGGAQVITMSLGGLPSMSLGRALRRAVAADVVVMAAAGNCVGEVVFPARYGDCIAIGGTDWQDRPWRGTSRGEAVAVSAPAENVFRARVSPGGIGPGTEYGQGQGTSFAVALVAGVAALWLAHHGRANLLAAARANGETLQTMVRRLLRATARRTAGWDSNGMGAGVVDALALLQADLQLGRSLAEAAAATEPGQAESAPVRSLMVSTYGEAGDPPDLDWRRYGPELAYAALRGRMPARPAAAWLTAWPTEAPAPSPVLSQQLQAVLGGSELGRRLRPDPGSAGAGVPQPEPDAKVPPPSGPRVESAALSGPFVALLAHRQASRPLVGPKAESAGLAASPLLTLGTHPDDILGQVEAVLRRMPEDEVPNPEAFRKALTILLREGEDPVRRYVAAPDQAPSGPDRMALEALICADGTRPSLVLRDGWVNPDHPLAGRWAETLHGANMGDLIKERALAVGCVDSTDAAKRRPYYGTAWLVEAEVPLVLTNLHVLLDLRADLGHLFLPGTAPGTFRVRPGIIVDFSRESNRLDRPPFRVVEATASGVDGPGFRRLDLATLRLEPTQNGQDLPTPIPVCAGLDVVQGRRDLCVIGYPGPPDGATTTDGRVDWGWVIRTLFGSTFGVKRLAPGQKYRNLGSLPGDTDGWVFGHDATTLAGSSGSPLLDWKTTGAAVGLHFAGSTLDTNCAHALAKCSDRLRALGVRVTEE